MSPHLFGHRIDATMIPDIQSAVMALPNRLLASLDFHSFFRLGGHRFIQAFHPDHAPCAGENQVNALDIRLRTTKKSGTTWACRSPEGRP